MSPGEFFKTHHSSGEISKELQKLDEETQLRWEVQTAHPAHSPGPVASDEMVCRPHTNPTHYDTSRKELKPTAFDDAADKGLSVDRLNVSSVEHSVAKARKRAEEFNTRRKEGAPHRTVFGHSVLAVASLRAIFTVKADGSSEPQRRGLGVYDTALEGEPEHADVCQIAPNRQGGRSARFQLFQLGNAAHRLLDDDVTAASAAAPADVGAAIVKTS